MKVAQSRMGEDIRTLQETLGLVSGCRCPREGAGPSPPHCVTLQPWVSPSVKDTRREEWEGCPKGGAQPTRPGAPHPPLASSAWGGQKWVLLPAGQAGGRGNCVHQPK